MDDAKNSQRQLAPPQVLNTSLSRTPGVEKTLIDADVMMPLSLGSVLQDIVQHERGARLARLGRTGDVL